MSEVISKTIEKLLSEKFGTEKKITKLEISNLPPKGFTSVLLKLNVTVRDQNKKEEQLHLIAKILIDFEIGNDHNRMQLIFKKEASFYDIIIPTLKEFQYDEGVSDVLDNFAEFYGAKYHLDGKGEKDTVILLEDLCAKGFNNTNHLVGFDLQSAENILRDLAKLHGTAIALKIKKPDIFEEKIKQHCSAVNFASYKFIFMNLIKISQKLTEFYPEYKNLFENALQTIQKETRSCREPFSTLIHFDTWVNNIMSKTEKDGTARNILLDFQVFDFGSPASDVLYFLWGSVNLKILKQNLDHLLTFYHQSLMKILNNFNIDTEMFEYKKFDEELKYKSEEYEFGHALLLKCLTLFCKPEGLMMEKSPDLSEFVHFIITESKKRGWLV